MGSVSKARPRSGKEIEDIAYKVIESFQADALQMITSFDVEGFFEFELKSQTGIEPIHQWLPDGLDGYTNSETKECFISLKLMEYGECEITRRRLRATQAHEIGHCFLHVEDARRNQSFQQKFLNDRKSSLEMYCPQDVEIYENPEWQAWRFASALLMPEVCFRSAVNSNWTKKKMKIAFDVNPSFLDVRLQELKISKHLRNG
jgi:hypothetical protein